MLLNARVTAFTISKLLRENQVESTLGSKNELAPFLKGDC